MLAALERAARRGGLAAPHRRTARSAARPCWPVPSSPASMRSWSIRRAPGASSGRGACPVAPGAPPWSRATRRPSRATPAPSSMAAGAAFRLPIDPFCGRAGSSLGAFDRPTSMVDPAQEGRALLAGPLAPRFHFWLLSLPHARARASPVACRRSATQPVPWHRRRARTSYGHAAQDARWVRAGLDLATLAFT